MSSPNVICTCIAICEAIDRCSSLNSHLFVTLAAKNTLAVMYAAICLVMFQNFLKIYGYHKFCINFL